VFLGVSPFITKVGVSPISYLKAGVSPFFTKAGTSLIPYIERRALSPLKCDPR
jgi:hypothetical protein